MQEDMPIPPRQGWIVFHTPKALCRMRWPSPNSIKNRGMPSRSNIMEYGMRKAPEIKQKQKKKHYYYLLNFKLKGNISLLIYKVLQVN